MGIKQQTKTVIDIGAYAVKMMQCSSQGKIIKSAVEKLPEGSIRGLFIEAEEPLIKALKAAKHKSGATGGSCTLTLSGKDMIVRHLSLPKLAEKQLYQNVLLEMASYLPVDIEKQVIDYKILEETKENDTAIYRILVATVHKRILERFTFVLKKAGFTLKILDPNENAQEKLIRSPYGAALNEDKDKGICIIDMGAETTKVNLFHNGRFFAGYLLNRGGNRITQLISQHMQCDSITAENFKLKNVFFYGNIDETLMLAVKNEIDSLIYEISKVADYFWSRTGKALGSVLLCGGASQLGGLQEYFQANISIAAFSPKKLLEKAVSQKNFAASDYASFLNTYAASFREELK